MRSCESVRFAIIKVVSSILITSTNIPISFPLPKHISVAFITNAIALFFQPFSCQQTYNIPA